jgi:hypothetical protein
MFLCRISNEGLGDIGRLESLTCLEINAAGLTTSGLKPLNSLTRLRKLKISDITPDEAYLDLSGLVNLKQLTLGTVHRGEPLRDQDLAFLPKLTNLEWFQMNLHGISDAGLAHVAGLTRLTRLSIGDQLTDAGLAHLAGMKQLENLGIAGDFTDEGLLRLQDNLKLSVLRFITPNPLSDSAVQKLGASLPRLFFFRYGLSARRMRVITFLPRLACHP